MKKSIKFFCLVGAILVSGVSESVQQKGFFARLILCCFGDSAPENVTENTEYFGQNPPNDDVMRLEEEARILSNNQDNEYIQQVQLFDRLKKQKN